MTDDPLTDCPSEMEFLGQLLCCRLPGGHDGAHETHDPEHNYEVVWFPFGDSGR